MAAFISAFIELTHMHLLPCILTLYLFTITGMLGRRLGIVVAVKWESIVRLSERGEAKELTVAE